MHKKILKLSTLLTVVLYGVDMPPMPPMIPTLEKQHTNNKTIKKTTKPKSCELIPPMVIFLPPPMEKELVKCKNEMFKPKKELVQKQLQKLLKKKITINKIEIVKKFNQLYKITYNNNKTILTNKTVDGFIKQ